MLTATCIISRNDPDRTNALVERLQKLATKPQDIYVFESGSDLDKLSKYWSVVTKENTNWVRGLNLLRSYADSHKMRHAKTFYDSYWFILNDAQFPDDVDPWVAMEKALADKPRWGVAHPAQYYFKDLNHPGHPLYRHFPEGARKVSFVEFVCPLYKREFLDKAGKEDGTHLVLDEDCSRGWG